MPVGQGLGVVGGRAGGGAVGEGELVQNLKQRIQQYKQTNTETNIPRQTLNQAFSCYMYVRKTVSRNKRETVSEMQNTKENKNP